MKRWWDEYTLEKRQDGERRVVERTRIGWPWRAWREELGTASWTIIFFSLARQQPQQANCELSLFCQSSKTSDTNKPRSSIIICDLVFSSPYFLARRSSWIMRRTILHFHVDAKSRWASWVNQHLVTCGFLNWGSCILFTTSSSYSLFYSLYGTIVNHRNDYLAPPIVESIAMLAGVRELSLGTWSEGGWYFWNGTIGLG